MSAFRRGFLQSLAENGVTPAELEQHLEKRAGIIDVAQVTGLNVVKPIGRLLEKTLLDAPIAAALGTGALAGLGGAYAVHRLTRPPKDQDQIAKFKNEALMREIAFQAQRLKSQQEENR